MKTTVDISDEALRAAKVVAASRGMTLRQLFSEALEEKLRRCSATDGSEHGAPWMVGFGALSDLADESRRVLAVIDEEFERIEPEDIG